MAILQRWMGHANFSWERTIKVQTRGLTADAIFSSARNYAPSNPLHRAFWWVTAGPFGVHADKRIDLGTGRLRFGRTGRSVHELCAGFLPSDTPTQRLFTAWSCALGRFGLGPHPLTVFPVDSLNFFRINGLVRPKQAASFVVEVTENSVVLTLKVAIVSLNFVTHLFIKIAQLCALSSGSTMDHCLNEIVTLASTTEEEQSTKAETQRKKSRWSQIRNMRWIETSRFPLKGQGHHEQNPTSGLGRG